VDGSPVEDVGDLQRLMVAELIGVRVRVSVLRRGDVLRLELVPEELVAG
jgi:hypothetical protein